MPEKYRDPRNFLNSGFVFAIVGASNDKHKKGFLIFEKFLKKQLHALPVNTEELPVHKVQSVPCFPNLESVKPFPNAVVIIETEPEETMKHLRDMRDNRMFRVWLEKSTYENKTLEFCKREKFDFYAGMNILEALDLLN